MDTDASINPMTVVGTRIKLVFRLYAAQAKLWDGQYPRFIT